MTRLALPVVSCLLVAGCASSDQAVRALGEREAQMFTGLRERLSRNEALVAGATASLGEHGADYAARAYRLDLAVARAKRLDAMRVPWTIPWGELATTRRAVMLLRLYEIEMAEQRVLDARIRERRAAAAEILASYRRLRQLTGRAAEDLTLVLAHLSPPSGEPTHVFSRALLDEITGFRARLEQSEHPRLRAFAEEVAGFEQRAREARERADATRAAMLKAKGE